MTALSSAAESARHRYMTAPDCAAELLPPLLPEAARALPALRLAAVLALECNEFETVLPLLMLALNQPRLCMPHEAELRAYAALASLQHDDPVAARQHLSALNQSVDRSSLHEALGLFAEAQLALCCLQPEAAAERAGAALQRFESINWDGPWALVHLTLAQAHGALGDTQAQRIAIDNGAAAARSQQRLGLACQFDCAQFDLALRQQQLDAAAQSLAAAEAWLPALPTGQAARVARQRIAICQARWLAAQGQLDTACQQMPTALDALQRQLSPQLRIERLEELAQWQSQVGAANAALATLAQAQELQLTLLQRSQRVNLDSWQHQLSLEQAERQRLASEAQLMQMDSLRHELEDALQRQQDLHEELVAVGKLTGLADLLQGLARSLDAPLRKADARLSEGESHLQALHEGISSAEGLSRRRAQELLDETRRAGLDAQDLINLALAEIANYKSLRDAH